MENEARFNLNKALQDWKAELAAQTGIGAENIRELETHLLESIDTFRKHGCSDEDAFLMARRKLGSVQQLGAEFAKENLLKVWRDRVFWITAVLLFMQLTTEVGHTLLGKLAHTVSGVPDLSGASGAFASLLVYVAMVTGFAEVIFRRLHWIFARRWRLAVTGVIAVLGADFVGTMSPDLRENLFGSDIMQLAILAFAVLVLPREFAIVSATTHSARRRSSTTLWRDRLFWVVFGGIAINIWILATAKGAQVLIRLEGEKALAHLWFTLAYILVMFLPILAVALMLASARLSVLDRWLRTRWRVAFIGGALAVLWVGLAGNWSQFQHTLLNAILGVALVIAMLVVAKPSRAPDSISVPKI